MCTPPRNSPVNQRRAIRPVGDARASVRSTVRRAIHDRAQGQRSTRSPCRGRCMGECKVRLGALGSPGSRADNPPLQSPSAVPDHRPACAVSSPPSIHTGVWRQLSAAVVPGTAEGLPERVGCRLRCMAARMLAARPFIVVYDTLMFLQSSRLSPGVRSTRRRCGAWPSVRSPVCRSQRNVYSPALRA